MGLDVLGRESDTAAGMGHRESQGGLGHKIDTVAQVGTHTGGGFAALFGADAGDDEFLDTATAQPEVQPSVGECVVGVFVKTDIRGAGQPVQGFDKTRFRRKGALGSAMKDVHHRNLSRPTTLLQFQQGALKG